MRTGLEIPSQTNHEFRMSALPLLVGRRGNIRNGCEKCVPCPYHFVGTVQPREADLLNETLVLHSILGARIETAKRFE